MPLANAEERFWLPYVKLIVFVIKSFHTNMQTIDELPDFVLERPKNSDIT